MQRRFRISLALATTLAATPLAAADLAGLDLLGRYDSGLGEGATEIVAYDPGSRRAFVVNATAASIDIVDLTLPSAPALLRRVDVAPWGAVANSVDSRGGLVAVAVEATDRQAPGRLVFLDADGDFLRDLPTGALPDMVAFSPDGRWAVVANEGEPNDDYTVDPEGSVTIVDLAAGVAAATSATARFVDFNVGGPRAAELPAGVRIYGPGATVAQDLEPEYVAISPDSQTAYVTLQEANAVAAVDLATAKVVRIVALGFKDHAAAGSRLDPSDKDAGAHIATWPVRGLYLPDAIATFVGGDGDLYVATANEGDSRDYDGFSEEERVGDLDLDPAAFPDAATLQANAQLGRLKTTSTLGDSDGDGDFDVIYSYGARSFSIWGAADGGLRFDSGDDLESIVLAEAPAIFNSEGSPASFDQRSDDKGPEPEAIAVGRIGDRTYAFVGAERTGGTWIYDVTDPAASAFVLYRPSDAADVSPEGLELVPADASPTGRALLLAAHEVSGTLAIYQVRTGDGPGDGCAADSATLCLQGGRFQVQANWRTAGGLAGFGRAQSLTSDSGYFWFFGAENVELVVKVLDACVAPFDRFWVYASGLTNVEVELRVTDTTTGQVEVYRNPSGAQFAPIADTSTFAACP